MYKFVDEAAEQTVFASGKIGFDSHVIGRWIEKIKSKVFSRKLLLPFYVVTNLKNHLALSAAMSEAGIPPKAEFYPGMRYRYLRSVYLGGGFSVSNRLAIAVNHYRSIARFFKGNFLPASRSTGHLLWSKTSDEHVFDITLRFPYAYNFDGDLCLTLGVDQKDVYIITFSIAQGSAVNNSESQVLLVTGIQGINGKIELIRKVTEVCNNVSPAHLLIAAAESLALSIGIKAIVGVGNSQTSVQEENVKRTRFSFNYDEFWMPVIGEETPSAFYSVALPFTDKPIESIQAKHRSRARKRREIRNIIRNEIIDQAGVALGNMCLK